MPKYCQECGKQIKAGHKFCPTCAHDVGKPPMPPAPEKKTEDGKQWSMEARIICGVTTLIVTVLIIIAIVLVFTSLGSMLGEDYEGSSYFQGLGEEGVPMNQECTTAADCNCTKADSIFCNEEYFEWKCELGECTAEFVE